MRLLKFKKESTLDHIPSEAAPMVPVGNDRIRYINNIEFSIPDDKQEQVKPYGSSTPPLIRYERGLPSIPENIDAEEK